jgi:hypothetical protein
VCVCVCVCVSVCVCGRMHVALEQRAYVPTLRWTVAQGALNHRWVSGGLYYSNRVRGDRSHPRIHSRSSQQVLEDVWSDDRRVFTG